MALIDLVRLVIILGAGIDRELDANTQVARRFQKCWRKIVELSNDIVCSDPQFGRKVESDVLNRAQQRERL
jgi:hypothetical protein